MNFKTQQETFWSGQFGSEYIDRNIGQDLLSANLALFSKILWRCEGIQSVIEFGANVGMNLKALKVLNPNIKMSAVEINSEAVNQLKKMDEVEVFHDSILDFKPQKTWDIALIKTVLIHIDPNYLNNVYEALYKSSKKYIVIAEYFNTTPTEVVYRGHTDKLFKRDFAGEMLTKYKDLSVVDYGFVWNKDPQFPQDDITWFLLKKA